MTFSAFLSCLSKETIEVPVVACYNAFINMIMRNGQRCLYLIRKHEKRTPGQAVSTWIPGLRTLSVLIAVLCLATALCVPNAPSRAEALQLDCIFGDPGFGKELTWHIPYSDGMFSQSAKTYHHDLAQASLGLALSAFRENFDKNPHFIADNHVIDYLTQAGFSDFESTDYDQTPSLQTVATVIGSKEMTDAEGPFMLIAVGVSGGGYSHEWLSNFTVGNADRHVGFNRAAQNVEGRILLYMTSRRISGRIKLWISGYSRAAAISNIVGADMTDYGPFGAENTFVYTFATPRTTREESLATYLNIFNIIGKTDVVPMVPMAEWGFRRYGNDLFLPAQETDTDFHIRFARASKVFEELTGIALWNNPEVNHRLRNVLSCLLELCPDTEAYTKYLEGVVKDMWTNRTVVGMAGNLISVLSNKEMLNEQNQGAADVLVNLVVNSGVDLVGQMGSIRLKWNKAAGNIANVAHEHQPSTYLSWLFSSDDPADIFTNQLEYQRIVVVGDANLSCFCFTHDMFFIKSVDFDGKINEFKENGFGYADIFMTQNDQTRVAVVPKDGLPYTVEILTKDGSATLNYLHYNVEVLKPVEAWYADVVDKDDFYLSLSGIDLFVAEDGMEGLEEELDLDIDELEMENLRLLDLGTYEGKVDASTSFLERLDKLSMIHISRVGLLNMVIITPAAILLLVVLIVVLSIRHHRKKKRKAVVQVTYPD